MLYLIGGPGRSGKTTLATRLTKRHGIPYFSLDYLMMGLHFGVPALEINPNQPEAAIAPKLWRVCKPMLTAMIENGEHYCVEGFALTPEYVSELTEVLPLGVRACFLGYCTVDVAEKLENEGRYLTTNSWPPDRPREEALAELELFKKTSISLEAECKSRGCAFFDTSNRFEQVIAEAEDFLVNRQGRSEQARSYQV